MMGKSIGKTLLAAQKPVTLPVLKYENQLKQRDKKTKLVTLPIFYTKKEQNDWNA